MTVYQPLSIGQCATLACLLEVTAPKPGNVHRGADFEDITFLDFALSAVAIGPTFERASELSVGQLILRSIEATQQVVQSNTNLGLVLLMAPLAKVAPSEALTDGIKRVLASLTPQDAAEVYSAIQIANPGGMGKVDEHDISSKPPSSLIEAMALAADRDLIARQYINHFQDCQSLCARMLHRRQQGMGLMETIVHAHVEQMAAHPDSLIARKCGQATSEKSAALAAKILAAGQPGEEEYEIGLADLDFWLRSDGHRRNPGTTADMIGAALFWLLRTGQLKPPFALEYRL